MRIYGNGLFRLLHAKTMSEQQKVFYSVAIAFDHDSYEGGKKVQYFRFLNCNNEKIRELRATCLNEGLQVPLDLQSWIVIFPWQIRSFEIYRQKQFFQYEQSNLRQTVFDGGQKKV